MKRISIAKCCLTSVVLIAGICGASHGVTIQDFEARSFISSTGEPLRYRLFIPKGYDSSQSYPLVLFLHGGLQRGNVKWLPATTTAARFCADEELKVKH